MNEVPQQRCLKLIIRQTVSKKKKQKSNNQFIDCNGQKIMNLVKLATNSLSGQKAHHIVHHTSLNVFENSKSSKSKR